MSRWPRGLRAISLLLTIVMVFHLIPRSVPVAHALRVKSSPSGAARAGEIIVKFKEGSPGIRGAQTVPGDGMPVQDGAGRRLSLLKIEPGGDVDKTLDELRKDSRVLYAEPNYELYAASEPNDPMYSEQWGLDEIEADIAWDDAADALDGGQFTPVVVAVLDTGVAEHEDLPREGDSVRVLPGRNLVEGAAGESDASDDSSSGHGTHVAGIIAASANNSTGIAGVAGPLPVQILPVKVLDSAGVGTMYDVAMGIYWAVDNGARVINLSLGARIPDFPATLADAVQYAQEKGAVVVAAAGNEGEYSTEGFYPACLPGVVSVGATGKDHHRAAFSNRGIVQAPGVNILSTLPGNGYGMLSGTSMSAAFTSGVAAMYLSTYPHKSVTQVAEALENGQEDYPEDCTWYWWGQYCNYHYYVLNAPSVLTAPDEPWDSIELIEPDPSSPGTVRMSGEVTISASVTNPLNVHHVEFAIGAKDEDEEETVIGSVYGIAGGGPVEARVFSIVWDSTEVPDGRYVLSANLYGVSGGQVERLHSDWTEVVVANHAQTGLVIDVKKPNGEGAAGAWVTVCHADVGYLEPVMQGPADRKGRVVVPGSEATSGNQFLVIAQGSEPDFLYFDVVRAPATVLLDGATATRVTVSGRDTDGNPLGGAPLMIELLEANIPGFEESMYPIRLGWEQGSPYSVLDSSGLAEIYLSSGRYDMRVISGKAAYYLIQKGLQVTGDSLAVQFHPEEDDVARVNIIPKSQFERVSVLMNDYTGAIYGWEFGSGVPRLSVSPGWYEIRLDAIHRHHDSGYDWTWYLRTPALQVASGEERDIEFGLPISATISRTYDYYAGEWAVFQIGFPDQYGNRTTDISYQPTAQASSSGGGGVDGGGWSSDSSGPAVVRAFEKQAFEKQAQKESGSLQVPKERERPQRYRFNASSRQFETVTQAVTWVDPVLEIRDAQGNLVPPGEYDRFYTYDYAYWDVPDELNPGDYRARVTLSAGPLGPTETGGVATSGDLEFTLQEGPSSGVTVEIVGQNGETVVGGSITLVEKVRGRYYEREYGDIDYSTGSAVLGFEPEGIDPEGEYAWVIWAEYNNQYGTARRAMWMEPLPAGGISRQVTLQLPETLRIVSLVPVDDSTPEPATIDVPFEYLGYILDDEGVPAFAGHLGTVTYGITLCIPDGQYVFQAFGNTRYVEPSALSEAPGYYFVKHLSVGEGQFEGGAVEIGGADTCEFTVATGPSVPQEYRAGAVALFAQGLPYAPVLYPSAGQVIVTSSGPVEAYGVLARDFYDGCWNYWLSRQLQLAAGEAVTWRLGSTFGASITPDRQTYGLEDTVKFTHLVQDEEGNRLVAIGVGLEFPEHSGDWGESLAGSVALRVPGAGPVILRHGEEPAAGWTPVAQSHKDIAPFLTIRDPGGNVVLRYKRAGPSHYDLEEWEPESGWGSGWVAQFGSRSTFFGGEWLVPEDAAGGAYTALLELGVGPEGSVSARTTFEVGAAPGAPVLESPDSPTNLASVVVRGYALGGSTVNLAYSVNGGAPVEAGSAAVPAEGEHAGEFSIEVTLPGEGTYVFTARATRDGMTGAESDPVTLVVDRTPPAPPANLSAVGQDETHILVSWTASPDTDVAGYSIQRDGVLLKHVPAGQPCSFLDSGLEPGTQYTYQVAAVDRVGNLSAPSTVTGTTSAIGDVLAPTTPTNVRIVVEWGGIVRISWKDSFDNIGVAGYRVYRSSGTAEPEVVGQTGADTLKFTDSGLAAETSYTYAVSAVDAAGNESARSQPLTVGTPAIRVNMVSLIVPHNMNGHALPGSDAGIILRGEPNRQGAVSITWTSWYDADSALLDSPRAVVSELPLVEDRDSQGNGTGTYGATFTLPAGTAEISQVSGFLSDGAGHQASGAAAGLPLPVAGSLKVEVIAPPDAAEFLRDSRLLAWSASRCSGSSALLSGAGEYTLSGISSSEDYTVRIVSRDNRELARLTGVRVKAGLESPISIQPSLPASLDVRILGNGGLGVEGIYVSLVGDSGQIMASGYSNDGGYVENGWAGDPPLAPHLLSGARATVRVSVPYGMDLMYLEPDPVDVDLQPGPNSLVVNLPSRPMATLEGRITDGRGEPLPGAQVVCVQSLKGRSVTFNAVAGDDGRYSVQLLAASVTATFSCRSHGSETRTITLSAGETHTLYMTLNRVASVTLDVYTKRAGQPEYPLEIDWRVAIHFRIQITALTGTASFSWSGWVPPDILLPGGRPGDRFRITVNGVEARMNQQIVEVTLDENSWARAEVHISEWGRIEAEMGDEQGRTLAGVERQVHVYKGTAPGSRLACSLVASGGKHLSVGPLQAGTYTAVFSWTGTPALVSHHPNVSTLGGWSGLTEGVDYARFEATVEDGEITHLGDIALPYSVGVEDGYFSGKAGNGLTATPADAAPGNIITLRASYRYARDSLSEDYPRGLKLLLDIPNDCTYVPGSAAINVIHGSPETDADFAEGKVTVDLGDSAGEAGGIEGTVTYQVRVDRAPDWPIVSANARARFDSTHTTGTIEEFGKASVRVHRVTLAAQPDTEVRNIPVSGRAPGGATVRVYDRHTFLGEATASQYGVWRTDVLLPNLGKPSVHWLTAQTVEDGVTMVSAPVRVRYAMGKPVVNRVTMYQQDGRHVTFDPSSGVAMFPYVYVPGMPFTFEMSSTDNEYIDDVKVSIEGGMTLNARYEEDRDCFVAQGVIASGWGIPGDISITYVAQRRPWTSTPPPPESVVRESMPDAWRDAVITVDESTIFPQDLQARSATVSVSMGAAGKKMNVWYEVWPVPDDFSPSTAALALPSGMQPVAYDYSHSLRDVDGRARLEISCILPLSEVEALAGAGLTGGAGGAGLVRSQDGGHVLVRVLGDSPVEGGLNVVSLYDTVKSGFEYRDKMEQLNELLEQATSNCEGSAPEYYRARLDSLAERLLGNLVAKYVLQLASIGLSVVGGGPIGAVAAFAVSSVITGVADARWEQSLEDLKAEMRNDGECELDEEDDDGDDVDGGRDGGKAASPTWILDPSGYVYEVVPENRIEGVTATAFQLDPGSGGWTQWDAAWCGQENPLTTDSQGCYGWDVPQGDWKVLFEKEGYQPATSDVVTVPPPRTDVNVAMTSLAAPSVAGVTVPAGGARVDVLFSRYMRTSMFGGPTVAVDVYSTGSGAGDPGGWTAVTGSVSAVDAVVGPAGEQVALRARFTPDTPLEPGFQYRLSVSGLLESYAGIPMGADYESGITPGMIGEVSNLQVTPGNRRLNLTWTDPADEGLDRVRVYWRPQGGMYGSPAEVAKGIQSYTITELSRGVTYDVKVTTVDTSGRESAGVVGSGTPTGPGGGGGGGGHAGGGAVTPPAAGQLRFVIGPSGGTASGFDGAITVEYEEGTFPPGTQLFLARVGEPALDGSVDLVPVGPVYEITTQGGGPGRPVLVTIRFDSSRVQGMDLRGLGVYRQDPDDPSRWIYVGGIVDLERGVIQVWLDSFSRYAVMARSVTFADLAGHWARAEVEVLASRRLVQGVSDRAFEPDRPVTRAELAKMLVTMLAQDTRNPVKLESPVSPTFADVAPSDWSYPYVETAAKMGIVKGNAGMFRPGDPVTRQEMAAMLVRAMHMEDKALILAEKAPAFDDVNDIDRWAYGYVGLVRFKGLMKGMTPTTFGPKEGATRAQAAVIVLRAMERLGMISVVETISGVVKIVEIEGRHLELESTSGGQVVNYVLVPDGGADGIIASRLEKAAGQVIELEVIREGGVSKYMRGPVVRVLNVIVPGCVLCR